MSEYRKALIHPGSFNNQRLDEQAIWDRWLKGGSTIVIGPEHPLEDVSYLDTLPSGTHLVYGGKVTSACVYYHLQHVCNHPRVVCGEIHIELSRGATFGDGHESIMGGLNAKYRIGVKLRS